MLNYQLQSAVDYAPTQLKVKFTVFYSNEDKATAELLERYRQMSVENIEWNFIALNKGELLRRAIGRNRAAKQTTADWIWFTDCDLVFGEETFESLVEELTHQQSRLVFPQTIKRTSLLEKNHELLSGGECKSDDYLKQSDVNTHTYEKAVGAMQIVHGPTAQQYGYCEQLKCYQQPKERWVKTYEDRAYRWILGTHGKPVNVKNIGIIRHVEKGRYTSGSVFSKLRKVNRKLKDKLFGR
ncbi:MAG: glycosyltransferase [Pseudomonadota bacterium]